MKSICNIFKQTDNQTGNFILFSKYVNDVSKSVVDSTYRVTPKKFMCLNMDLSKFGASGQNTSIPQFFQNEFENAISCFKNENETCDFSTLFWYKFISKLWDSSSTGLLNRISYIGNIDLESWQDGFADIILNIKSGSEKSILKFNSDIWNNQPTVITDFSDKFVPATYTQESYISGWSASDNIPVSGALTAGNVTLGTGTSGSPSTTPFLFDNTHLTINNIFIPDTSNTTIPDNFEFNTIIIFYEISDGSGIIKTDIPMGLYIIGAPESDPTPIKIYKSSTDAYGAGSGWSLRICTKFSPTPYGYLKVEEVALESGALQDSISALMSASAEAIKTINDFVDSSAYDIQTLKDLYSNFKNTRTNVPYPKLVNGRQYWFVNGRNTEIPCTV